MPSQVVLVVKKPAANAGDIRESGSIPGLGRPPGGGQHLTPIFLPGESHGQRRLEGYSPQCHKELDTTEATYHSTAHGILRIAILLKYFQKKH